MRWMLLAALPALSAAMPAMAQDVEHGGLLYGSLCAACHGPEGRGDGPMAAILDILPADLTGLAAGNDGVFPVARVARQIDGRDPLLAHGGTMPLFGFFFVGDDASMKAETGQPILTSSAIVDLVATGRTLEENGLIAIEDLFHSTARLVGHPLALRLDDGPLQAIVDRIAAVSVAPVPAGIA